MPSKVRRGKPWPEKKRERKAGGQLPLPTSAAPVLASATRVLPIDLKVGDRLVDETASGRSSADRTR
jgi:hypothetical protein